MSKAKLYAIGTSTPLESNKSLTHLCRHLLHLTAIEGQFVANLLVRHVEPHKIEAQDPDFQRLMMSGNNRVGQSIEACVTVVTRIALTSGFRVITITLDDVVRRTRGARDTIRPAQLADGLIALGIINEMLDSDLHGWTPVRGRRMGCHQYIPSSNATPSESNKSEEKLRHNCA